MHYSQQEPETLCSRYQAEPGNEGTILMLGDEERRRNLHKYQLSTHSIPTVFAVAAFDKQPSNQHCDGLKPPGYGRANQLLPRQFRLAHHP